MLFGGKSILLPHPRQPNVLPNPRGEGAAAGGSPTNWGVSGTTVIPSVVGHFRMGRYHGFIYRFSGTTGGSTEQPAIRFAEPASQFAAVQNDVFMTGFFAKIVAQPGNGPASIVNFSDTFDAAKSYIGGDYTGVDFLAIAANPSRRIEACRCERTVTLATAGTAFANTYLVANLAASTAYNFDLAAITPYARKN